MRQYAQHSDGARGAARPQPPNQQKHPQKWWPRAGATCSSRRSQPNILVYLSWWKN